MSTPTQYLQIAQAEDLQDLLDHISWVEVLKPALEKTKSTLATTLVNHMLGTPLEGGQTKEQLAGKIYGITEVIALIEKTLRNGARSLRELKGEGISF
jgi:hypothetical protein